GERVSLERFHEVPPAAVSAEADHVRILRDLAGTEVVGVAYGTEMAYYASHNPRSIIFGPGETERIHVPDERVALSEVVRAAEILTAFGTKINASQNTATRPHGRSRTEVDSAGPGGGSTDAAAHLACLDGLQSGDWS